MEFTRYVSYTFCFHAILVYSIVPSVCSEENVGTRNCNPASEKIENTNCTDTRVERTMLGENPRKHSFGKTMDNQQDVQSKLRMLPGNTIQEKYVSSILTQCPFAHFCFANGSDVPTPGTISCCKPCYCDDGCAERMDCCFKFLDKKKTTEVNNLTCISPAVPGYDVQDLHETGYYMVDRCFEDDETDCRRMISGDWGPFFPVYSSTSDMIYFNRHCAECNGINDTLTLNIKFDCHYIVPQTYDSLIRNVKSGDCWIYFPPPDEIDIEKYECYHGLVETCNVTGKWEDEDAFIREACHSIKAPYFSIHDNNAYANVFCKLCNGESHDPTATCNRDNWYSRSGLLRITSLLEWSVFKFRLPVTDVSIRVNHPERVCGENEIKHPIKVSV